MINLLPISGIKKIISEYRVRLATIALAMFAAIVTIALVLLLPVYLLVSHKQAVVFEDLSKIGDQNASTQERKEFEKIIKETETTLDLLAEKEQKFSVSRDILIKTTSFKIENIKITGMFYDRKDIEGFLSLRGIAATRKSLTGFIDILKKDAMFSEVSLPISDLVKDRNIDFTINIKLKANKIAEALNNKTQE